MHSMEKDSRKARNRISPAPHLYSMEGGARIPMGKSRDRLKKTSFKEYQLPDLTSCRVWNKCRSYLRRLPGVLAMVVIRKTRVIYKTVTYRWTAAPGAISSFLLTFCQIRKRKTAPETPRPKRPRGRGSSKK